MNSRFLLFVLVLAVNAIPAPISRETAIDVRSEPADIAMRSSGPTAQPIEARAEHDLLFPRAPRDDSNQKQKLKQQAEDAAKKKAEDVAKKVGEKVATQVATTVLTAALGPVPLVGEIVGAAKAIASVVEAVVGAFEKLSAEDHDKESKFTQDVVGQAYAKNNKWNYLMINEKLKQSVKMEGKQGTDWTVGEREIKIHFGKQKYHFYTFGAGFIENKGDGGFLNWAWNQSPFYTRDGHKVTFRKPT